MSDVDKIVRLLSSDAIENRIAGAIVLGELRAKGANVVDELAKTLESGIAPLQNRALFALARVGARRAVPKILPLLAARDEDVRQAAIATIVSVGDEVLPIIRERLGHATSDEKRSIDAILAALGGKDAFHALLGGLATSDADAAKAAAIAARQCVRDADSRRRRIYLLETKKFLEATSKSKGSPTAIAAAVKILGFLEDEEAIPALLSFSTPGKNEPSVRHEALIALRFLLGRTERWFEAAVTALLDAAEDDDRALAQTALHTLASLRIDGEALRRLEKIALHPDVDRAGIALEMLARHEGEGPARALVNVLASTKEKRRAEIAAACLVVHETSQAAGAPGTALVRKEAVGPLAKALLEATDVDRAWLLRSVLRPSAKQVSSSARTAMLEEAMKRLAEGQTNWEPLLALVRDADPTGAANGLRTLARRLAKKDVTRVLTVLRVLCRSEGCSDDDRYALAAAELVATSHDTRASARAADESLRLLAVLVDRGADVAARLRKDKSVALEHLYYVGFHFAEQGHPLGEELLRTVVERGGRAKIAKMARSKLALGHNHPSDSA